MYEVVKKENPMQNSWHGDGNGKRELICGASFLDDERFLDSKYKSG